MSNFSEYIKSTSSCENIHKTNIDNNLNKNDLEELLSKYSSYNQNELLNEFIKLTYEKKQKGELDAKEINNLKQTIVPFLNNEQKENLDKILSMVENVK